MSNPGSCCVSSCDTEILNVPGTQGIPGTPGAPGTDGADAFTTTTANILLPGSAGPVTVPAIQTFADTSWMAVGQKIFISDGTDWGTFEVLTITSSTGATLSWLDYNGDSVGASTIDLGARVSPSGTQPALAAPLPTAFTDNTTGTASNTLAAGVGRETLMFPIQLAAMTTAAADLLTNYVVGYAFKILSVSFVTTTVSTGAGGTQTLNLEIGSTNLTGGVVTVTLAGSDTLGELTAGTAVTAANVGTATDTLSVEVAAGGTVFTAGAGILIVMVQNMDTASAVASLADHVNGLITSLT